MNSVLLDLRSSIRNLIKNRSFTSFVLIMLTLGAGADAVMFSVTYSVLIKPLSYPASERLMQVNQISPRGETHSVAWANFDDWRTQSHAWSDLAAYITTGSSIQTPEGENVRVTAVTGTANLLSLLGVKPLRGRLFTADEDQPGKPCALELSAPLWASHFASDPEIVGKSIRFGNQPCTVIGIMPRGFAFPDAVDKGVWTPIHPVITSRGTDYLNVIGRLKREETVAHAGAEMSMLAQRLAKEHPEENEGSNARLTPYQEVVTGNVRAALWSLIGAVLLVQLIICANVGNMQLARALGRSREVAVRLALGASRWHIARLMLTESFALALVGAGAGLLAASWSIVLLKKLAADVLPRIAEVRLYPQVCIALFMMAGVTALLFGFVPVFQARNTNLETTLRENSRGTTAGRTRAWLRDSLVVGQLGLAVVLLFGSVVLARSLYRLLQQDLGFNPQHVLILHTTMNGDEYNGRNLATSIYLPQLERIRQLPGVQTAGLVTFLPLSLGNADGDFKIVGRAEADNVHSPRANLNAASDDYFRAMQIPLMQGRFFSESDGLGAPRVAIVNDELAHKYFAGQDPVGKQIVFSDPDSAAARPLTIVGVVHGSRQRTLAAPPQAEIYFSMRQVPNNTIWSQFFLRSIMTYVVRSEGKPEAQTTAVQAAIQGVEPGETVFDVRPMEDVVSHFVEDRRLSLVLLGSFAGLALIVAAAGLFAMLSYSVRQRTQEIAVRMALGASHADVLQLIGRHALRLTVIGLGTGVVAAIVAGNLAASMLFGVQSWDPVTLCATTLTLLLVALPSAFFPAHRAASVNVLEALRTE